MFAYNGRVFLMCVEIIDWEYHDVFVKQYFYGVTNLLSYVANEHVASVCMVFALHMR